MKIAQARGIGSVAARITRGLLLGPPREWDVDALGPARYERLTRYE